MPDLHFIDSSRTFEAGTNNGAFDVLLKSFCRLPKTGDPCFYQKNILKGKWSRYVFYEYTYLDLYKKEIFDNTFFLQLNRALSHRKGTFRFYHFVYLLCHRKYLIVTAMTSSFLCLPAVLSSFHFSCTKVYNKEFNLFTYTNGTCEIRPGLAC